MLMLIRLQSLTWAWDNPIAGLTLQLNFEISNLLQTFKGSRTFHLTGDGRVQGNL